MNIISWLEAKYRRSIEKKREKAIKRRQFNMTVAEETILGVRLLAAVLKVPKYINYGALATSRYLSHSDGY